MVHAIDFSLCHELNVKKSEHKPKAWVEMAMSSDLSDKTRIPLIWVFTFIAFFCLSILGMMAGAILYVSDLKLQIQVEHVRVSNLEAIQASSVSEMKGSIQEIKLDIKDIMNRLEDRGFKRH